VLALFCALERVRDIAIIPRRGLALMPALAWTAASASHDLRTRGLHYDDGSAITRSRDLAAGTHRHFLGAPMMFNDNGYWEEGDGPNAREFGPDRDSVEEIVVMLPAGGRYIVTTQPDQPPHIARAGSNAEAQDPTNIDGQILANQLRLIEAFWHKTRQNKSVGSKGQDRFAWGKLEDGILEGGSLARHFLAAYDEPGR